MRSTGEVLECLGYSRKETRFKACRAKSSRRLLRAAASYFLVFAAQLLSTDGYSRSCGVPDLGEVLVLREDFRPCNKRTALQQDHALGHVESVYSDGKVRRSMNLLKKLAPCPRMPTTGRVAQCILILF